MAIDREHIVRHDFPPSPEGYDRTAVDAHLEAVAAALAAEPPAEVPPAEQVLAAGRLLLGEISRLRVELKNVSAALREQGVTVSDALEELLDLGADPDDAAPAAPPAAGQATAGSAAAAAGPVSALESAAAAAGPVSALESAAAGAGPVSQLESAAAAAGPVSALEPGAAAAGPVSALEPAAAAVSLADEAAAVEDARLVALDMALGGRSRAEIEHELARFGLPDRTAVVDAVLAAIG